LTAGHFREAIYRQERQVEIERVEIIDRIQLGTILSGHQFGGVLLATVTTTSPAIRLRSQTRAAFFLVFFAMTAFAAYEKNSRIFDPTSPIAQHYAPATWFLSVHALFAILAMAVPAFQFSNRLRARYLKLHRVLGYVYVTSVFIAAPSAILVSVKISRTFTMVAANCMQSFCWLATTAVALYCIRKGYVTEHRRWMIRSYPFAMVFTVTRVVQVFVPFTRGGQPGNEALFWSCILLAALLPNVFVEWPVIFSRKVMRADPAVQ
jgi:uncharacterized membrane protein